MVVVITFSLLTLIAVAWCTPFSNSVDPFGLFRRASVCSTSGQTSCHNTTVQDTCCFEYPGGLLLQTQFWDTNPSTGPTDSWTIHGLWPDDCDQTFEQNCDATRAYTNTSELLTDTGSSDTLSFMEAYWVDINGDDESFWEAVAFFDTVVRLFKTLPTFTWLSNQGITPSTSKTYTYSQLTSALQAESGVIPALSCDGSTLNEAWWFFNLKGSIIDGTFIAIDAPSTGTCPTSGISYTPKSESGTSSSTSSTSTPTNSGGLPAKATIMVQRSSGSLIGGLLSAGTWSTQTLATYALSGDISNFMMKSSKGNCGVSNGQLSCGSSVSPSSFSAVNSGNNLLLAFQGSTSFSSDAVPSGAAQESVFTGSDHSQQFTLTVNAS